MEEVKYHLNQTIDLLSGPTREQIIVFNQWAAVALDRYHSNCEVSFHFTIDGKEAIVNLCWDSDFSKDAMIERRKIAEEGGVSLAMFVMSVLLNYHYLCQTEIGEGVDYRFQRERPNTENFLAESHYVEVSALLEETKGNTLSSRVNVKHKQIENGTKQHEKCSIIITLFSNPSTIKEIHVWN